MKILQDIPFEGLELYPDLTKICNCNIFNENVNKTQFKNKKNTAEHCNAMYVHHLYIGLKITTVGINGPNTGAQNE